MRSHSSGTIINISSVAGKFSTPLAGWYAASKHAVEALSDALRQELRPLGIRVVVIEPGAIKTGFDGVAFNGLNRLQGKLEYAKLYQSFRKLSESSYRQAPGPDVIAKTIEKAVDSQKPKARYALPLDSKSIIQMRRFFGDAAMDALIRTQIKA